MASSQSPPPADTDTINNNDDDEENEEDDPPEPSGFDLIETKYDKLDDLVSEIQKAFGITSNDDTSNTTAASAPTADGETTAVNSNTTTTNGDEITEVGSNIDNRSVPISPRATTIGNSNINDGGAVCSSAGGETTKSDAEKIAERREEKLVKDVKYIRKNVEYIKKNVESLKKSPNSDGAEELLQHLMNAAINQKADDFPKNSENLNHLLHMVAKLKQWVPSQRVVVADESKKKKKSNKKKKESPIVSKADKENAAGEIVKRLVSYDCKDWGMNGLLKSYGELKVREKLCLLCFSVFRCDVGKFGKEGILVQKNLVIKKKILIFWWVGEGFIDPPPPPVKVPDPHPSPNTVAQQNPNPNQNSTPNTDPQGNPNQSASMSTDENQIPQQGEVEPKRETIETIGEEILEVLWKKGFIEPVIKRGRESGSYQMHPFVHSFVSALAKKAGFFDFSNLDGNLTPQFTLSQRACLLKSQGKLLSSCRIWKDVIDNRTELKKFATVQTLFNVNESIIDIKPEWFSKMKYLSVLHLGSWRSEAGEHIEVEDPIFMEEFKNMKQLKLFSLQGVATIMKLPDSVCKLSNLIILDLRECHNLEILPADIGSLKNLTHLDITNCHLLTKLPIGISLLSKLEVLNGFVIYNQDGVKEDQKGCFSGCWKKTKKFVVHDLFRAENKEICTLKDLLKLGNLRELSIVVNRDTFPNQDEVELFRRMGELCSLKISWVYDFENDSNDETGKKQGDGKAGEGSSSHKCGRCKPPQVAQSTNVQSSQKGMEKLQKLELWSFPCKKPLDWLRPNELKSLEKLYIKGGNLEQFKEVEDGHKWKVKMLRLKYLRYLQIEWRQLNEMFPEMTYLEKHECKKLGLFPCDHEGVWRKKEKIVA